VNDDKFTWREGDVSISQCQFCVHKSRGRSACLAFPGDIPLVILTNEHDHHVPYPGDCGIRFTPKRGQPAGQPAE
jgi:hypothetical protein